MVLFLLIPLAHQFLEILWVTLYSNQLQTVSFVRCYQLCEGRARIRKMAGSYDIDLDVEVDPELSIYEAHELSELVEEAIRKELPEVYAVMIHVEPKDSCLHQREEEFGLNPKHLENETEK